MPEFAQRQNRNQSGYMVRPGWRNRFMPPPAHDDNLSVIQPHALSNQVMQRLLQARAIQPKLKINQPGDKYEQEADRVANEVMRMPEPNLSASSQYVSVSAPSRIQRMCSECEEEELQRQPVEEEEEEELLQAKEISGQTPEINSNIETNINAVRSGGRPLPDSVREYFEPRFGHDFSQVRIHTGRQAAESARAINARAYTVGHNVVFGAEEYAPHSLEGSKLLAHELTHVLQQLGTDLNTIQRQHTCENDPLRAPTMICDIGTSSISGPTLDIFFDIESKTVSRGDLGELQNLVRIWHAAGETDRVKVDGFASCDGDTDFNWPLSCDRAMAVRHELLYPSDPTLAGIDPSFVERFANGETDRFSTSLAPNRRATVTHIPQAPSSTPRKQKEEENPSCTIGPGIPNTTCFAYLVNSWWLPLAYVNNATCACSETPNVPTANCVRKFLQDRLAVYPTWLKRLAAAQKKKYEKPGTYLQYQMFVQVYLSRKIYRDHVDAYRSCCCTDGPAPYLTWIGVTSVPLSCADVKLSIELIGSCHGTPGAW